MASLSPTSAQPTTSKEKAQSLKDVEKLPTLATLCDVDQCDPDASNSLIPAIKWKRRIQFVTLCSCLFVEGWNDGSTGPLLPRIQDRYHVNFAVVSLLFVFLCIGYICGALLNVHITDRYGFGKVITVGTFIQAIAYSIEIPAPPFPVWVFAFFTYGFGTALQSAQVNAFVAGLNAPSKMSLLHACYGTGALLSPFVATRFSEMNNWSYHYFTAFGISLSCGVILTIVFRFKTQEEILVETGYPAPERDDSPLTRNQSKYKQLWNLKVVHLLAFFIFAYCGVEVTIGGWAVTHIIHRTGGGPSSGYVSSGFFGGLAAGRAFLIGVNRWIGERRAIFVYAVITIALEIFIWAYPKLIPSAIAISFVGFFLGPMFPIIMNQCSRFIPHWLLIGSIGWIVSFGLLGTAVVPFMTGALSQKFGIVSLQPLLLIMLVVMMGIWTFTLVLDRRGAFSKPTTPALSRTETEMSR